MKPGVHLFVLEATFWCKTYFDSYFLKNVGKILDFVLLVNSLDI